MDVTLSDPSTGRTLELSPDRLEMLEPELRRVLADTGSSERPYERIAPDCLIAVWDEGTSAEYELLGRTVLYDRSSETARQFYFGLMILEWLESVPVSESVMGDYADT